MSSVVARAYSSSANLGAGFDILSLAHKAYHDEVEAEIVNNEGRGVLIETSDGIPKETHRNSAGAAVLSMLEDLGLKVTVRLKVKKGVPFGLGLGSSGASASAAVSAVNELLGLGLRREDLVKYAMLGEGAVSGSPHPDNVAASLFGGVVAVVSTSPIRVAQIPVRVAFNLLLIIPRVKPMEGKTRKARELVPNRVNLSDAVQNARFISSLILGLESGNRELIRLGLNDEIVEKARTPMYPHYPEVKKVALESDAIGVCVSGAGPSVLVFYDKYTDIMGLKDRAENVCKKNGFACDFIETELAGGVQIERIN